MPSLIRPTTIRFPIILAYYFINAIVWISDFKPLHLEGDVDVHKYYLELYNLENLQPKLHYLHFQFLRICKKPYTRIFPMAAAYLGELWTMRGAPPAVAAAYLAGLGTMRGAPPEAWQPPI